MLTKKFWFFKTNQVMCFNRDLEANPIEKCKSTPPLQVKSNLHKGLQLRQPKHLEIYMENINFIQIQYHIHIVITEV